MLRQASRTSGTATTGTIRRAVTRPESIRSSSRGMPVCMVTFGPSRLAVAVRSASPIRRAARFSTRRASSRAWPSIDISVVPWSIAAIVEKSVNTGSPGRSPASRVK
jgi:hypothetical protein